MGTERGVVRHETEGSGRGGFGRRGIRWRSGVREHESLWRAGLIASSFCRRSCRRRALRRRLQASCDCDLAIGTLAATLRSRVALRVLRTHRDGCDGEDCGTRSCPDWFFHATSKAGPPCNDGTTSKATDSSLIPEITLT